MGAVYSHACRRRHPQPAGPHRLGCVRGRLPPVEGGPGLFAQVHYPADDAAPHLSADKCDWFRREAIASIATNYGLSPALFRALLGGRPPLDPPSAPMRPEGPGWPVIVFSHGIWGCCEMYTQFCRELASLGAIVVALEHEDGSAIIANDAATGEPIPYERPPADVGTAKFRQPFLERRSAEMRSATAAIVAAADGRDDAEVPAVSRVLATGDAGRLLLVGHSFGSSSVVRYLGSSGAPCPYRGAIVLDLWPEALLERDFQQELPVPFAFVMCEDWSRWYPGCCRKLIASGAGRHRGAVAIRGAKHQWIAESNYFAPTPLLRRMGLVGDGDPERVHEATRRVMRLFVKDMLGPLAASAPAASETPLAEALRQCDREIVADFL